MGFTINSNHTYPKHNITKTGCYATIKAAFKTSKQWTVPDNVYKYSVYTTLYVYTSRTAYQNGKLPIQSYDIYIFAGASSLDNDVTTDNKITLLYNKAKLLFQSTTNVL